MPTVLVAHPSADLYGSDRQLLESITGLRSAGFDVTVCLPAAGPLDELLGDCDVQVAPFPVLRKALQTPAGLARLILSAPRDVTALVRRLRRVRPDAVYVNTLTIPWWVLAARLARVPVLVHVHEAEQDGPRVVRAALAAPLLLASAVVANSRASVRALAAALPVVARRTQVVPNGVADPGPAPADPVRPPRLALVARLSPRKGIDVALEATARLRREGRDVHLDVCGTAYSGYEWYERELRERAAADDLVGAVTFRGYVAPTTPVLAQASVVLVPSRVEPFGNTAVEAMFAQRPLVASNVQGLAEIIADGRTGLLVPPEDPAALADAIGAVLDDPALGDRLARAGRADAIRRFSAARYRADIVGAVSSVARHAPTVRSDGR